MLNSGEQCQGSAIRGTQLVAVDEVRIVKRRQSSELRLAIDVDCIAGDQDDWVTHVHHPRDGAVFLSADNGRPVRAQRRWRAAPRPGQMRNSRPELRRA